MLNRPTDDIQDWLENATVGGSAAWRRPRMIAVVGPLHGVGTTSIALNSATALVQLGNRVVFVDADASGGDAASHCGISSGTTLADVIKDDKGLLAALHPGPNGVRILPAPWNREPLPALSTDQSRRTVGRLLVLGVSTDIVVVDAGNAPGELGRRICSEADAILIVVGPDENSRPMLYPLLQPLSKISPRPAIHVVVNREGAPERLQEISRDIGRTAFRLLSIRVASVFGVPEDGRFERARLSGRAMMAEYADRPATQAVNRLAEMLVQDSGVSVRVSAQFFSQ